MFLRLNIHPLSQQCEPGADLSKHWAGDHPGWNAGPKQGTSEMPVHPKVISLWEEPKVPSGPVEIYTSDGKRADSTNTEPESAGVRPGRHPPNNHATEADAKKEHLFLLWNGSWVKNTKILVRPLTVIL